MFLDYRNTKEMKWHLVLEIEIRMILEGLSKRKIWYYNVPKVLLIDQNVTNVQMDLLAVHQIAKKVNYISTFFAEISFEEFL